MRSLKEGQKFALQSEMKICFLKSPPKVNQMGFLLQYVIPERRMHQPNSSCRGWNYSILSPSLNMENHLRFLRFPWALATGSCCKCAMLFSCTCIETNVSLTQRSVAPILNVSKWPNRRDPGQHFLWFVRRLWGAPELFQVNYIILVERQSSFPVLRIP